ncbi:pyridoxamine 5'-phosphate oxidase family protein [Hyphomicrobium sp. 2TAF46]|uniref:pyridoxamine 5'-phosphate oxidase family protein n=1 Tax=Hyphomicrobium sp. 2TAF46 TaxID=3233019 RepID=UPI003F8FC26E
MDKPALSPPSDRTKLRRYHWLAKFDRESINQIIDAGIICQVGYVFDGAPYVTPTSHWRIDDHVYWHGSSASRMLRAQEKNIPVCFSVTHIDGIVFARAAMNHNVLYRSVMAFGNASLTEEDEKRHVLSVFTNRLAPGLWDYARKPSEQEWKATKVVKLKLDEVAAKVNDALPGDEDPDLASDRWAGMVPLELSQKAPIADPRLASTVATPDCVTHFCYASVAGDKSAWTTTPLKDD